VILIHQRHRQTDGQTDRRTDRRTDGQHAISIPRYALVHRAVKIQNFDDGGFLSGWSFVRVVFCPCGLLSVVGIFRGLLSGGLMSSGLLSVHRFAVVVTIFLCCCNICQMLAPIVPEYLQMWNIIIVGASYSIIESYILWITCLWCMLPVQPHAYPQKLKTHFSLQTVLVYQWQVKTSLAITGKH